ncbi:hypothetical protein ABK040_004074 [Willaertia magna]
MNEVNNFGETSNVGNLPVNASATTIVEAETLDTKQIPNEHHSHWKAESITFLVVLGVFQVIFLILFWVFFDYEITVTNSTETSNVAIEHEAEEKVKRYYKTMLDVGVMCYVGFGFLMTFLKKYGYSAFGFNFLISAFIFQWGVLNQAFWRGVYHGFPITGDAANLSLPRWMVHFEMPDLVEGHFATASVLVSFGAFIGKVTPLQLLVAGLIHVVFYAVNFYVGGLVFRAADIGGSMFIHLYGAVFGVTVAFILWNKKALAGHPAQISRYTSDLFSLIGTIFLFLCWPSFNGALAATYAQQFRTFINTIMSLMGSTIATFFVSRLVRGGLFAMEDVQNATLAGGVAIGAVADYVIQPGGALTVGLVAGAVSALGFRFVTPNMRKYLKIHDTCGVTNLHGMPGFLGGVASIVAAGVAAGQRYNYGSTYDIMFKKGTHQWGYQFATLAVTIGIAVTGGVIAGFVIRWLFPEKTLFVDEAFWEVASDDLKVEDPEEETSADKKNNDIELKDK